MSLILAPCIDFDELSERDIEEAEMDREDGMTNVPPAVVLLRDIHQVWPAGSVFIPTNELITKLIRHNPQMWGQSSNFGKDLTVQRLGRMLVQAFKIHSTRQGDSKRGYHRVYAVQSRHPTTSRAAGSGRPGLHQQMTRTPIPSG